MILAVRCTRCGAIRAQVEPACHHCAVEQVKLAFQEPWWLGSQTDRRGLSYVMSGVLGIGFLQGILRPPWGWRMRRIQDRDAIELVPLWLHWLLEAPWVLFPIVRKLGLWRLPEEGGLWVEGRPSAPRWLERIVWCFVHDRDEHWTRSAPRRTREEWEYGIATAPTSDVELRFNMVVRSPLWQSAVASAMSPLTMAQLQRVDADLRRAWAEGIAASLLRPMS